MHFIAFPLFVGFFPFGLCSFRFVLYVGLTNKTKALDDPNIRRFEDIFTIFVSRQGSHKKGFLNFNSYRCCCCYVVGTKSFYYYWRYFSSLNFSFYDIFQAALLIPFPIKVYFLLFGVFKLTLLEDF